jgi:Flp pilus assembly pilin Flp
MSIAKIKLYSGRPSIRRRGVVSVEYAVMLALIGTTVMGTVGTLGLNTLAVMRRAARACEGAAEPMAMPGEVQEPPQQSIDI